MVSVPPKFHAKSRMEHGTFPAISYNGWKQWKAFNTVFSTKLTRNCFPPWNSTMKWSSRVKLSPTGAWVMHSKLDSIFSWSSVFFELVSIKKVFPERKDDSRKKISQYFVVLHVNLSAKYIFFNLFPTIIYHNNMLLIKYDIMIYHSLFLITSWYTMYNVFGYMIS